MVQVRDNLCLVENASLAKCPWVYRGTDEFIYGSSQLRMMMNLSLVTPYPPLYSLGVGLQMECRMISISSQLQGDYTESYRINANNLIPKAIPSRYLAFHVAVALCPGRASSLAGLAHPILVRLISRRLGYLGSVYRQVYNQNPN